jgi:arginine-tRNA-protein transferase
MFDGEAPFINEQFFAEHVTPAQLDLLLADGWRQFGTQFFRYSYGFYELDVRLVIPLRIRIASFELSKSQRRTLRRNVDLNTVVRPVTLTPDAEQLFQTHKQRFKSGLPDSIYDFLSMRPDLEPCEAQEVAVYDSDRLIAASYFDIGATANSGIYAMFDPEYSSRRLGIYTLLREIEIARDLGREFYYLGYAYEGSSFYDYKKQFSGSEWFDWSGNWQRFKSEPPAMAGS